MQSHTWDDQHNLLKKIHPLGCRIKNNSQSFPCHGDNGRQIIARQ